MKIVHAQTPFKLDNFGLPARDPSNNSIILNDKNWTIVPIFEDEFNTETSTFLKWNYGWNGHDENEEFFVVTGDLFWDNILSSDFLFSIVFGFVDCSNYLPYPTGDLTYNTFPRTYNRTFNNSTITITRKIEPNLINAFYQPKEMKYCGNNWVKLPKSYQYSQATLFSKQNFKYGFFEARFKINRPSNQSNGIGQCFWLYPVSGVSRNGTSEIDIAENDPSRNLMTSNVHYSTSNKPFWTYRNVKDWIGEDSYSDRLISQQEFHTYSCEWTPSEINTYYDNILVMHTEISPYLGIPTLGDITVDPSKLDFMNIILDIEGEISNGKHNRFGKKIDPNVSLPFDFQIDYVKVYKLNNSTCNLVENFQNANFQTYTYGLKKSITIGMLNCNTCSSLVGNGQNVSLRASDFIELSDGFEVDDNLETEFFATVNGSCQN